jgi:hypothetical protein
MPGPFIFVATNEVREGKLEDQRQRVPGWIDFIQSNAPRLIAFHEYVSADGAEVEYVQVHPRHRLLREPHASGRKLRPLLHRRPGKHHKHPDLRNA